MKTTDFEGKITKNVFLAPKYFRLRLNDIFSTETFFTIKVSIVLRLQNEHGHKRKDH